MAQNVGGSNLPKALTIMGMFLMFLGCFILVAAASTPYWWVSEFENRRETRVLIGIGGRRLYHSDNGEELLEDHYWQDDTCSDLFKRVDEGERERWLWDMMCPVPKATLTMLIVTLVLDIIAGGMGAMSFAELLPSIFCVIASTMAALWSFIVIALYGGAVSAKFNPDWDNEGWSSHLGFSYAVAVVGSSFVTAAAVVEYIAWHHAKKLAVTKTGEGLGAFDDQADYTASDFALISVHCQHDVEGNPTNLYMGQIRPRALEESGHALPALPDFEHVRQEALFGVASPRNTRKSPSPAPAASKQSDAPRSGGTRGRSDSRLMVSADEESRVDQQRSPTPRRVTFVDEIDHISSDDQISLAIA